MRIEASCLGREPVVFDVLCYWTVDQVLCHAAKLLIVDPRFVTIEKIMLVRFVPDVLLKEVSNE